uniref:Myosin motor domain-containing protein n=1 Tax=Parascaris equorum TaxID=6256 RepID=A0A914REB1_PAREQ
MMYRESLNNLMNMLNKTHPHFIRCIIPNEKKKSGLLDAALVLNQLTCNGVLEGIRICRKGFPNRSLHDDFRQRYAMLASKEAKSDPEPKKCAEAILSKLVNEGALTDENFRVGKTKVFFKAGIVAHLEDLRDEKLGQILAVLRTWDWYLLYGKIKPMLKCGKEQEEMDKMSQQIKELELKIAEEEKARKGLEESSTKLLEEKNAVFSELEAAKAKLSDAEDRLSRLTTLKGDIDKQISVSSILQRIRY